MTLPCTIRGLTTQLHKTGKRLVSEQSRRKKVTAALQISVYKHKALQDNSLLMQAQLRNLTRQLLTAQEDERKKISREVHDSIAQILAGINVHLVTLTREAAFSNSGLKKRIASTQRLVNQSLEAVHRFARELRPKLLDDLGLVPALKSFLKTFLQRTGIHTEISFFPRVNHLDILTRTVLYRVAQEALTNVGKHAQASAVKIVLEELPDTIRMTVHDDGKSFDTERMWRANGKSRLGLLSMRERAQMVGGHFGVHSAVGVGTTVTVEVPRLKATTTRKR
jgi:two-component system sensor histidine kinase DegS